VTRFYLGAHMPHWLSFVDVPLFVSRTRLYRRAFRQLPRAIGRWAMDSGGFTEVTSKGGWTISTTEYAAQVRQARDDIGGLDWAAPMDWMCEPQAIRATGLSVREHLERTVANGLELRRLAPDLPFIYVLQGWKLSDYHLCVRMYEQAGVDLTAEAVVGVGSVCRRQSTDEIGEIMGELSSLGLKLHGFGVKTKGLAKYAEHLTSADSLAWSTRGRNAGPCSHTGAVTEANCPTFALGWRRRILETLNTQRLETYPA
jgi:hypothetical protein